MRAGWWQATYGKGMRMNKAITDGVLFMPPAFAAGLDQWSSGDGTPGSDTYDGAPNAAFVPADQDFGGCLELQKTQATQKLRFMGETPILPGCYLRITARVKAISGNLPDIRIAAWAGRGGGAHLDGVTEIGPAISLGEYGKIVEVSAIVGTGSRDGVDMAWGRQAVYGHFGLDLTGPNGGVLRIDDLVIEDVTGAWLRDMLSVVDVRDYGAVGDGATDDSAAFEAADAAAGGRTVLVPEGVFHLGETVTINSDIRFEGRITMPDDKMLLLPKRFDYPAYAEAFGDEDLALRKAFQALLNNSDHDSLDLGGRKITVSAPIDMQAAVPNKDSYSTRRVIRNGQIEAGSGPAWATETRSSRASYSPSESRKLTDVANIANIPVGSLVEGNGVGREIYVRSKNVAAGEITLNAPLHDAAGTQNYTFRSFKYMLDFVGFSKLSKFVLSDVEIQCNGECSAIRLAPTGLAFHLRDCFISRPRDRGVTSIGAGCQGMLIDRCQFLSNEDADDVPDRVSIAINGNSNDIKLRNNRATKFRHFALLAGANNIVTGNHFFQGDSIPAGVRSAGLVLLNEHTSTIVSGNYVDNCFIEWTNEQDPTPAFSGGYSFSALSITDNIFLSGDVAPWFSYIVVKPHGEGHFLNGVTISNNRFRSLNGPIDRAERVDTSFADLDYGRMKAITVTGNSYHGVDRQVANPLRLYHDQATASQEWTLRADGELPFQAWARSVEAVVAKGKIRNAGSVVRHSMPYARVEEGPDKDRVVLVWDEAMRGEVIATVRIDL